MSETDFDFSKQFFTHEFSPELVTDTLVKFTNSNPDTVVNNIELIDSNKNIKLFQVVLSSDLVQFKDLSTTKGIIQVQIVHEINRMNANRTKINSKDLPEGLGDRISMFGAITGFYQTKDKELYTTQLKANVLFDTGVLYLKSHSRFEFSAIIGQWDRTEERGLTDNVRQFDTMVGLLGRQNMNLSKEDIEKQAAFATWTGQRAKELHFEKSLVFNDKEGVTAIFYN